MTGQYNYLTLRANPTTSTLNSQLSVCCSYQLLADSSRNFMMVQRKNMQRCCRFLFKHTLDTVKTCKSIIVYTTDTFICKPTGPYYG